jgi:hypothetical protein
MKPRLLVALIAVAMMLSLAGIVVAAPANTPEFFSSLTVNMSSVYPGDTPIFTIQGTMDLDAGGTCLAIALPNFITPWDTFIEEATTDNGSDITVDTGSWTRLSGANMSTDCGSEPAAAPSGTEWVYLTLPNNGTTFQSIVAQVRATVEGTTFGVYTIRAAMNDSAVAPHDTWLYVDMTGNPLVQNAAATTLYVANNSSQCLGNSPCYTGSFGLIPALGAPGATTIIVLGAYNAYPATAYTLLAGQTLKGQSGASININDIACQSTNPFLTVTGAATIQDLTFDGTCTSGNPTAGIDVTATGVTIQNVTIRDFANAGILVGVGGTATINGNTFTGNGIGINHSGGTANIGTSPTTGNTFTGNSIGISSIGTGATIKGNTISGGTTGIALTGVAAAIYGNTVSGASGNQIACSGAFAGAGFNYLGGNIGGGGTNCADATDQLGSPIVSWTDSTSLSEASVTGSGPIFNLGNVAPFGYAPPLGRNSKYYATTAGATAVTITSGGATQFKMLMAGTGCNPMTSTCWESLTNGRAQSGAGYYFRGSQDPTAITLRDLNATSTATPWPLVIGAVVVLAAMLALGLVLRRRTAKA